ncbi:VPS53, partial [Cordylochernes scorpioides]
MANTTTLDFDDDIIEDENFNSTITFAPEVQKSIEEVLSTTDPLDAPDFNAIDYINSLFPTEQSLSSIDEVMARMRGKIRHLDEDIRGVIRGQTATGQDGQVALDEAHRTIELLFIRIRDIKARAEKSEQMTVVLMGGQNRCLCGLCGDMMICPPGEGDHQGHQTTGPCQATPHHFHHHTEPSPYVGGGCRFPTLWPTLTARCDRSLIRRRQYGDVASLLQGVVNVLDHFKSYQSIPQLRRLADQESPSRPVEQRSSGVATSRRTGPTPRRRPPAGGATGVQMIRATRADIADARARQRSSTEDNCVFVEHCPDFGSTHYLQAVEELVGGAGNVLQVMKMDGHMLVGLSTKALAERLIRDGLDISHTHLRAFPFKKRAERITVGNLPFFVDDAAVIEALKPYSDVTSIVPIWLRAGRYTFTDGRREAFILLKEGSDLEKIPTRVIIRNKGNVLSAFISYGVKCSRCGRQGHCRANCPIIPGRASNNAQPQPAPPPSGASSTESRQLNRPTPTAPAPSPKRPAPQTSAPGTSAALPARTSSDTVAPSSEPMEIAAEVLAPSTSNSAPQAVKPMEAPEAPADLRPPASQPAGGMLTSVFGVYKEYNFNSPTRCTSDNVSRVHTIKTEVAQQITADFHNSFAGPNAKDGSGRPRATTEQDDRAIVRMAVTAPESTLSTIQRVTGTQMTINRRLRERNLRARRPLRCLPLTPVHRQVRLQWCRERSTWNCADWGRIVFSDESRFLLCPDDRRKRVWIRPGQRVDPGLTVEHHTGPQQGVMVWGAISFDSRTPLVVIPGTLTAQRYVDDILRPVLLPFLSHHPGLTFQQDNARPHTARVTMDCLQSCRTLLWPARSPDLSPIEHIWDNFTPNQQLAEACLVISILDPKVNLICLHKNLKLYVCATRRDLLKWFVALQLVEYTHLFQESQDIAWLDKIDRRYAWLKKHLVEFDEKFGRMFPPDWELSERIAIEFCHVTRRELAKLLKARLQEIDVRLLLFSIQRTVTFEMQLGHRFSGSTLETRTLPQPTTNTPSSPPATPPAASNPFEDGSTDDANNPFAEDAAAETQANFEKEDGRKASKTASATSPALQNPFQGIISSCFEPHLNIYVESQDKITPSYRAKVSFKEMSSYRRTSANRSQGWNPQQCCVCVVPQTPSQMLEKFASEVQKSRGASAVTVLPSCGDLFVFYKKCLVQCTQLSTGRPMLALASTFQKYLREYATRVLQGSLPSCVLPNVALRQRELFTLRRQGSSLLVSNPASLISSLLKEGEVGGSSFSPAEQAHVCTVLSTAEYCLETTQQCLLTSVCCPAGGKTEGESGPRTVRDGGLWSGTRPLLQVGSLCPYANSFLKPKCDLPLHPATGGGPGSRLRARTWCHDEAAVGSRGGRRRPVSLRDSPGCPPPTQPASAPGTSSSVQAILHPALPQVCQVLSLSHCVLHLSDSPSYDRVLCSSFIPRFVAQLFKCRPLSPVGAEQLLLDTHMLKTVLLELPTLGADVARKPPASYIKIVVKGMTKAEMLLKVVMAPHSPPENFVDNFIKLLPESDQTEFQKVLDMKVCFTEGRRIVMAGGAEDRTVRHVGDVLGPPPGGSTVHRCHGSRYTARRVKPHPETEAAGPQQTLTFQLSY